jgi:hypothetical protein
VSIDLSILTSIALMNTAVAAGLRGCSDICGYADYSQNRPVLDENSRTVCRETPGITPAVAPWW